MTFVWTGSRLKKANADVTDELVDRIQYKLTEDVHRELLLDGGWKCAHVVIPPDRTLLLFIIRGSPSPKWVGTTEGMMHPPRVDVGLYWKLTGIARHLQEDWSWTTADKKKAERKAARKKV